MSAENLEGQFKQWDHKAFITEQLRNPIVAIISLMQFQKAGLLTELENQRVIPVAHNPNPYDVESNGVEFEQWAVEHPKEMHIFEVNSQQRLEALTYLYLGKSIGSTAELHRPAFNPRQIDTYLASLRLLSTMPQSQNYINNILVKRGLMSKFEREGILPQISGGSGDQPRSIEERRKSLFGYIYIGYMLAQQIDGLA